MIRADGTSRYAVPFSTIPALGQVSEYPICPPNKQAWDVFHKHDCGSYFAYDAEHFKPQPASATFDASTFASHAEVLAWEAASDNIHISAPGSPVEGSNIVPHGSIIELSVAHVPLEDFDAVWLILNIADGSGESRPLESECDTADSGK